MTPPPPINMADVARAAGVSIASVSRALNGAPGVSEETRIRIKTLAEDLSYVVSPDASRLSRRATGRIAVVWPGLATWFYAEALSGILSSVGSAAFDVLLYQVMDDQARHRFFQELPARRQVDAVIVIAFPITDDERRRLELLGVTLVVAGGTIADYPHVRIDDAGAAQQAVNHLIQAGHERIGMLNTVGTWDLPFSAPRDRLQGFRTALAEAGLPFSDDLVVDLPWSSGPGPEGMNRLLSIDVPPTAVFAFSDEIAIGALRSLHRAAIPVPQGMSVIGVDDNPMAQMTDLTTVHQPVFEQGFSAGQLAMNILQGEPVQSPYLVLPTQLVVRGTTGPPDTRSPAWLGTRRHRRRPAAPQP
jgi:DNA-binding LacI/PurR family transcriptional regulator